MSTSPKTEPARTRAPSAVSPQLLLPCLLLFGAMFNLTLIVAGLKEFVLDDLGGTVADATLFFSVETFAYILFAPLWGVLSDRLGRRRPMIVIGFLLSAFFYTIYGVVSSIDLVLVLRFIQGGASVMAWSLVMALVVDHSPEERRGRHMGLLGASLILGVALGAPLGGYITRWSGPRAPLATAAALFALLALGAHFLREGGELRQGVRIREIIHTVGRRPQFLLPMFFHFIDRLAVGLFVVVFPLYLDTLGTADPAVRGRYLALFLLPFAMLQYFTGRMAERTGPYPPLLVGSALYGLLLMTVGYSDLRMLWPVMAGLGVLASIMFPPALLLTVQLSDARTRGSAVGGFNLAGSLGFGVGPLIGAWAYATKGFGFAFVLCGFFEIVAAVVGLYFWRRLRDR